MSNATENQPAPAARIVALVADGTISRDTWNAILDFGLSRWHEGLKAGQRLADDVAADQAERALAGAAA